MKSLWCPLFGYAIAFFIFMDRQLPATDSKTNVVIIFVDDLGYGDIGPYGATKQKTPHLDRMAREGMKLTSFYAAPVCSVSRAQLLTGCYGARVSVPGVFGPGSAQGLHPNEITIAERLKPLGYASMCIGKWHVGDQPEFLPTRQGFDHYFGIPYSNDMQRKSSTTGESVVPLLRDDKVVELLNDESQSQIVERYTSEAVSFIRSHATQPFLLYMPHTAVHTPIWPGKTFRGKSNNGRFGDWVEEVDWSVGQVMDTLRELRLDQNTLVLFTSDNGPWLIKGTDGGSALPLRGGKGSTWEGGVRVPTIAWWPGRIAAGSRCDAVAGTIDILPTAVAIAGGTVPAQPVIDGRDLSPLLLGKTTESQREAHFYFAGNKLQAVRQGPWKLAIATQPEPVGKLPGSESETNPRLYHLDREIGERTNLAKEHPDIVKSLQALIDRMDAEIGGESPAARRPPGIASNPKTLYPSVTPPQRSQRATAPAGQETRKPLSDLKIGEVLIGNAAPNVIGKPFQIRCQLTTDARNGVLVAHGGTSVGYSLFLRNGSLVFMTSDKNEKHEATLPFDPSSPSQNIIATLSKEGVLTLQLGTRSISVQSPGVLSRQPKENFCVGFDDGMPVTQYNEPTRFVGKIEQLTLTEPRE
jgi:arylsulfatase A-like enzyme